MATTTVNINSSLKINVTPIEDGASGGVLFQKSDGKLGQSSNLHWDDTNSRLSIGQGTAPGARLDVRLPGVLSTDLGVRFRNSSNTGNQFEILGNGRYALNDGTGALNNAFTYLNDGRLFMAKSSINFIEMNINDPNRLFSVNGWQFIASGVGKRLDFEVNGSVVVRMIDRTLQLGSFNTSDGATNTMYVLNGTPPNTNHPDLFKMYSADIVAGNAAPHFRTENGSIIKLFRGAALTVSDGTLTNAVTRIAELEARLQAHGLIA